MYGNKTSTVQPNKALLAIQEHSRQRPRPVFLIQVIWLTFSFIHSSSATAADSYVAINLFFDHPYIPVDRSIEVQFSAVGELSREVIEADDQTVTYFGSAVVVSPCFILTAHHVAYGDDDIPIRGKDYSMEFRGGVGDDDGGYYGSTNAHPVLAGDYAHSRSEDWALLQLDRCAGSLSEIGWAEQSSKSATALSVSQPIAMAGMSRDRRGTLNLSIGNFAGTDPVTGTLRATSSADHRESGGAVYTMEDGQMKLIGIITGGLKDQDRLQENKFSRYSSNHANLFISTNEILNKPSIKFIIQTDKASVKFNNPAHRNLYRLSL